MKVQEPISEVVERTELLPGDIVFVTLDHHEHGVISYIDAVEDIGGFQHRLLARNRFLPNYMVSVKVRKLGWISLVECWKLN